MAKSIEEKVEEHFKRELDQLAFVIMGKPKPARIFPKDSITVDMFGYAYFRDFAYKAVTHARVFASFPKGFSLNARIENDIVSQLQWLPTVFSYNHMCSYEKIKKC